MNDIDKTNPFGLKPVKGLEEWARKQYPTHFIYYRRKGNYSFCHCSECDARYRLRAIPTQDPFEDAAMDIEKPERDKPTKCRNCKAKAVYKPAGNCASEFHSNYVVYGQRINDETFIFRTFYTYQHTRKDCQTHYVVNEEKRILLQKGKKPIRYRMSVWDKGHWYRDTSGEPWKYIVHPRTFTNIKKTGMFKYVPVHPVITCNDRCWVMKYYIAAARYPDMEMIIKMGLVEYANRLVHGYTTNINPRGKTIEDRLRVYKNRIPYLIKVAGNYQSVYKFQIERKMNLHWTDEEIGIFDELNQSNYDDKWLVALKYMSISKLKRYFIKQKIWMNKKDEWRVSSNKRECRNEYYDYLAMRADQGYDMTNDIILFPKDLKRRHDEMVLEAEKAKFDKRIKEVTVKYPKIKTKYKRLSEKYSAAAGGYIIRPAKDAGEIVTEGRLLHHCVGTDRYLEQHNTGKSFILFLRPIKDKDIPFITVEIKDFKIVQWYGAYDRKPNEKLFDKWLKTYVKELEKRTETGKKRNKTAKNVNNRQKTA